MRSSLFLIIFLVQTSAWASGNKILDRFNLTGGPTYSGASYNGSLLADYYVYPWLLMRVFIGTEVDKIEPKKSVLYEPVDDNLELKGGFGFSVSM